MINEQSPVVARPGVAEELCSVRLLNFPLQLFDKAREHHDELMREFALLALSPPKDRPGHVVPAGLIDLIASLGIRYPDMEEPVDAVRDAAIGRGDAAIDLAYDVAPSVGASMRELGELLEQADRLCRAGELLTVAATPLERSFWAWFTGAFSSQVTGAAPTPWDGPLQPDF